MRRAKLSDLPALLAYLEVRTGAAMFPLSNLVNHGLDRNDPRSMSYWINDSSGQIVGAVGITQAGMVMPQCADADFAVLPEVLKGRGFTGLVGLSDQVERAAVVLGCSDWPTDLQTREGLFHLPLASLNVAENDTEIVPIADAPRETILEWTRDYLVGTLGTAPDRAAEASKARVVEQARSGTHVVLMDKGTPVAMTGLNARYKDAVMIGGVYTPPLFRSRGFARRAVARHLQAVFEDGARHAYLAAHDPAAIRAYDSIGFQRTDEVSIVLFRDRQIIHD